MADLTITAANVLTAAGANTTGGTAGETIAGAGKALCLLASDSKIYLFDANDANKRNFVGISRHAALANQPISYITSGSMNLGATLTPGTEYYGSNVAGGICPRGDLTTGDQVINLGHATTASNFVLAPRNTGVIL